MSLKHAILGFLSYQELSGYDLQKKIEKTIDHFWPSTQSQIYRSIKELIHDGYIQMQIVYQNNRPNKKIYSITTQGSGELIKWLRTNINLPNYRNQFLVQFFFSERLDNKAIVKNLINYKSIIKNRLSFLTSDIMKERLLKIENGKQKLIFDLIAKNGIWALENELKWITHALNQVENEN